METVHFLGRVWPASSNISIGYNPQINWKEPEINFEAVFIINVQNSVIDVECRVPGYEPERLGLLFGRAYDKLHAAIGLVSFATGYGLGIVLDTLVLPDGTKNTLSFPASHLLPFCTAYSMGAKSSSFDEIYKIVQSDTDLFLALNDLTAILMQPALTEINCGRVLDGLRRIIAPGVSNTGTAWGVLQQELNISRAYRELVTNLSAKPRHADRMAMNTPQVGDIGIRTWTIFDRFLHYRKGGNQRLVPPQFPLL